MTLQGQQQRGKDSLLLSIWVIGYRALIRAFAVLQRVERLLAGSKRAGTNETRPN